MKSALKKPLWIFKHLLPKRLKVINRPQNILVGTIIALFLFATPVYAESWNAWFQSQFSLKTIMYAGICELIGCGIGEQPAKTGSENTTPTITYNYNPYHIGGLLGFTTNTMVAMYNNPPTSSTYYLANVGKELGLVSPAYAQVAGSGAGMIRPVEQLWQILRNISYLFFVIIFVAIGFMIMLRQKMNPQTVITIQSALPSLVIGLILVTFSYFIAALITDLAFLGVQIVAQVFASVVNNGQVVNYFDPVTLAEKSNIFDLYTASMGTAIKPIQNYPEYISTLGSAASQVNTEMVFGAAIGGVIFALTGGAAFAGVTAVTGGLILAAVPLIVSLILLIAFTVQFLKLMYKLVMAYIMILITTALGPLYITMSILPGNGGMLGQWWKTILGNALVFPAVFALFLFAGMIMKTDQSLWASTPPFFGNFSTTLLQPIVGFVLILGTPAIPDMVRKAVGATDLGPIGPAGIGGFMAGYGIGGKVTNTYWKRTPLKKTLDDREKYREALRARSLGLDTHNTARNIEINRTAAGMGNWFQRQINRRIYGMNPADPDFGRRNEARTQRAGQAEAQIDAARAARGEGGGQVGDLTQEQN